MSSINSGTIDNAVKTMVAGNPEAMRQLLTTMMSQMVIPGQPSLLEPTSGASAQKPVNAVPPQASLSVTGANGSYTGAITPAVQTVSPTVWYDVSYSASSNFANATSLPLTTATSFTSSQPGATLYWRVRSSYDQAHFNAYRPAGGNAAVSAGLQSSAATSNATALNITNYATLNAVPNGLGSSNVRVYGSAGPQTMFAAVKGMTETILPSATIINQELSTRPFVAYDGEQYVVRSTLPQIFADGLIPIGQVGVPTGGSVTLPTYTAVVSGGGVAAPTIVTAGANLSTPPTMTVVDSSGAGKGAILQAVINAGTQTGTVVVNAGNGLYGAGTTTVTASGGSGGQPGGGSITGNNGGRLTAIQGS